MSQYRLSSNLCGHKDMCRIPEIRLSQYRLSSNLCGPIDYQFIKKTIIKSHSRNHL